MSNRAQDYDAGLKALHALPAEARGGWVVGGDPQGRGRERTIHRTFTPAEVDGEDWRTWMSMARSEQVIYEGGRYLVLGFSVESDHSSGSHKVTIDLLHTITT